jgi:streptomycin 6-kinase
MIVVPEEFASRCEKLWGETGVQWARALPETVQKLCDQWQLEPDGRPLTGTIGLAVPVRRKDDRMMLKVSYPDPDSAFEAWALDAWNGGGAVRLIDREGQWNMLLERLDSTKTLRSIPINEAISVAAQLLRRLAVSCNAGPPMQSGTIRQIKEDLGQQSSNLRYSIPTDVVDLAFELVTDEDTQEPVLVNTDLHYENVLAGAREPWLAIDPKVVIGQVEFGIAPLIWNLRSEFVHTSPSDFLDRIVAEGGFDFELARRLTIVRTADYWLWAAKIGLTEDPKMCRAVIEALR